MLVRGEECGHAPNRGVRALRPYIVFNLYLAIFSYNQISSCLEIEGINIPSQATHFIFCLTGIYRILIFRNH